MKKRLLATALVLFSSSSYATVDGVSVNKSEFQHFVEMNCSGTLISGQWVLTAAHCARDNGLRSVTLYNGEEATTESQFEHPNYETQDYDVGLWKLENKQLVNASGIVSISPVAASEEITLFGFGGTAPELSYVKQDALAPKTIAHYLHTQFKNSGHSTGGDSGGAYVDSNNRIRAVHKSYDPDVSVNDNGMIGMRLEYAGDFLLDTINNWNYPTVADTSTSKTITVQSLHRGGVTDTAYTSGDIAIDYEQSTCDDGYINEFQTCSYVITSNGGHGQLYLDADNSIEVNKPKSNSGSTGGNTSANSGNGSSGGSLGLFFLPLLLVLLRRKL